MQKETKTIGFACFVGMFLGSLVALECAQRFNFPRPSSLLVGLVLGGALGYICQDLPGFAGGVARAWRKVGGWRPNGERWSAWAEALLSDFCLFSCAGMTFSLLTLPLRAAGAFGQIAPLRFLILTTLAFACSGILLVLLALNSDGYYYPTDYMKKDAARARKYAKNLSPPFVAFWIAYGVVRIMAWAVPRTPTFVRFVGRFAKQAGIYIHSSKRTLCLVDSCLGVAVTFFANGSPLVYALIGAACSMVHYELVSVRWLHLPQKAT